jgi:hypothetical protein
MRINSFLAAAGLLHLNSLTPEDQLCMVSGTFSDQGFRFDKSLLNTIAGNFSPNGVKNGTNFLIFDNFFDPPPFQGLQTEERSPRRLA